VVVLRLSRFGSAASSRDRQTLPMKPAAGLFGNLHFHLLIPPQSSAVASTRRPWLCRIDFIRGHRAVSEPRAEKVLGLILGHCRAFRPQQPPSLPGR
jgi:hypothetical protein